MPTPAYSVRHGFTLVELLVVIAIIALLAGMLLAGVSALRLQSRTTKCASNLRNFSSGFMMFAANNNGLLPQANDFDGGGNYYDRITTYVDLYSDTYFCPDTTFPRSMIDKLFADLAPAQYNKVTGTITSAATGLSIIGDANYNADQIRKSVYHTQSYALNRHLARHQQGWRRDETFLAPEPFFNDSSYSIRVAYADKLVFMGEVAGGCSANGVTYVGGYASMDPPGVSSNVVSNGGGNNANGVQYDADFSKISTANKGNMHPRAVHKRTMNIVYLDGHVGREDPLNLCRPGKRNQYTGEGFGFNDSPLIDE
jgi:prepilin-type N-terminal cleavage/methylation domain-containing protein/prepilin-type processing-associated H-X9-DG protein